MIMTYGVDFQGEVDGPVFIYEYDNLTHHDILNQDGSIMKRRGLKLLASQQYYTTKGDLAQEDLNNLISTWGNVG